jgi:hypothetical protein
VLVEAIHNLITSDTGAQAFLGTPATRPDSMDGVFPTQAIDQPTAPYIVMKQLAGASMSVTFQGTGALTHETWQISCYGSTAKNAKQLAKYIRAILVTMDGPQAGSNVTVVCVICDHEGDDAVALGRGTLFETSLEFSFSYSYGSTY